MNNPRITAKERNLIKGALRRVFSRSELRKGAITAIRAPGYSNAERPRVKTWYKCPRCFDYVAGYQINVDHIFPIVPTWMTLEMMTWETLIDRIWCEPHELLAICIPCHKIKSRLEAAERKKYKNERKKLNESKAS